MVMVRGAGPANCSCNPRRRVGAGCGTGSNPPGVKGWQRNRRHAASPQPRNGPCVAMATAAYSEQVGMNLHWLVLTACSAGEIQRRYKAMSASRKRVMVQVYLGPEMRRRAIWPGATPQLPACSRIRTISASSCANSMVSTLRRGWKMRSNPCGQQIDVAAQCFAHAALDAVALG